MDIVFRAAFGFLFVFLLTRIVGRRELSSLEPFDLILLVMIGDLVQQGITQNDFSVTGMVLVGGTVALMTVLVAWTDFRFPFARPAIARAADHHRPGRGAHRAEPAAEPADARRRWPPMLRQEHGLPSLDQVKWAILESNGRISFIPKMTLYLTEAEVAALVAPEDALAPVEACFQRLARGAVANEPRSALRSPGAARSRSCPRSTRSSATPG